MVGTPGKTVNSPVLSRRTASLVENFSMMYSVAPVARIVITDKFSAYEWKSGNGDRTQSLSEIPVIGAQQAAATHNMPCTVSCTPLARPVVPDVYRMYIGSCSEAGSRGNDFA